MPYITEEDLVKQKEQVSTLEDKVTNLEELKEISEKGHQTAIESVKQNTKKFKASTVILGILTLLGLGSAYHFMNSNSASNMISMTDHEAQVSTLQEKVTSLEENESYADYSDSSLDDIETYAVQIGAFEQKDLSLYSDNFVNFKEIKKEEYNKYALGNFESFEDAKLFRQELVNLGFTDAFIGAYQNGERLRIEKVE